MVQTGAGARRWRRRARPLGLVARVLALAAVLHFLVLPQIGGTRRAIGLVADLNPLLVGSAVVVEGLALAAYCGATSLFHYVPSDPWQMSIFVKNWAIAGGCLALYAAGPGRYALSQR